jgi:hypothetical protein
LRNYSGPRFPAAPLLIRTRTFFHLRGVIEAGDFDATLLRADTPA